MIQQPSQSPKRKDERKNNMLECDSREEDMCVQKFDVSGTMVFPKRDEDHFSCGVILIPSENEPKYTNVVSTYQVVTFHWERGSLVGVNRDYLHDSKRVRDRRSPEVVR